MKIEVIKGTVTHSGKEYGTGKVLEIDDDNAKRLVNLGYAKKADDSAKHTEAAGRITPPVKDGKNKDESKVEEKPTV